MGMRVAHFLTIFTGFLRYVELSSEIVPKSHHMVGICSTTHHVGGRYIYCKSQIHVKSQTSKMAELSENLPADESIRSMMEKLVRQVDLKTVTTKQFIVMLSQEMGGQDLSKKKQYIKSTLTEILDAMDNDDDTEVEDEDDQLNRTKKRSGLSMAKQISLELANFLGIASTAMARTDVVRQIWSYIKDNELQNPEDKREILLDDKMKSLFHCDKFTIFTMNKYVSSHMEPFPPVNLSEMSENSKKKKAGKAEKRAKNMSIKRKRKGKGTEDGEEKPKRIVKHPPFRLSPELSNVVGTDILPRPQVTRLLWVYIKKNNLQV